MQDNVISNAPLPDIPLPNNPGNEPLRLVSQKDFEEHKKDFNFQKTLLNWTFGFIVAILIVCLIAFTTFLLDAWRFHHETLKEYNTTIENLRNDSSTMKFKELEDKIEQLKTKKDTVKIYKYLPVSKGKRSNGVQQNISLHFNSDTLKIR